MKSYFIMTWIASKERIEEHDRLFKRWVRYMEDEKGLKAKYFRQPQGPEGSRGLIIEFEEFKDYKDYLEKFYQDEENRKLRDEWLEHIELHTCRTTFWRKQIAEDIEEIARDDESELWNSKENLEEHELRP